MRGLWIIVSGLALSVTAAFAGSTVTVKGSDTMVILGQRWAEMYMDTHPGAVVQVTGGGSGTGIAALINGAADVAQSSRIMSDREKAEIMTHRGAAAVGVPVAMDGVAVYVHKDNPVARLTFAQVRRIYLGDITNWKEVGGPDAAIAVYSRENNSGTYTFFKDRVLKNEDFTPECQMLAGTATVVHVISREPYAIGYGGVGYSHGVKAVAIAVAADSTYYEPTHDNVTAMKYPLSRYLYWYTVGDPKGAVKDLVAWVLSPAGQKVVADVGYYPLPQEGGAARKGEP